MVYDDGNGYFWINDDTLPAPTMIMYPKMVMHKSFPDLDGIILDDPSYNTAIGEEKNLFTAMINACKRDGDGFVEYLWPKPTSDGSLIPDVLKLSYVKIFEPLGWIVGTGFYLDEIEAAIAVKNADIADAVSALVMKIVTTTSIIIAIAIFLCFFFSKSLTAPITSLINTMKKIDLKKLTKAQIKPQGATEFKQLGDIFNTTLRSLNSAVESLKHTAISKERIESELHIAHEIQMSMIPMLFPAFPDKKEFNIYAILKSAKEVGGDLYNFFMIDDDNLCLVIGDVAGKGVPASLFMAVSNTLIETIARNVKNDPGKILTKVNAQISKENETCMFVTVLLGILNIKTGVLSYSSGGHNPPIIIRKDKPAEYFTLKHGMSIGIESDNQYENDSISLQKGDKIYLYTDGVTEAFNTKGEVYSETRLLEKADRFHNDNVKVFIERIYDDVKAFADEEPQSDDITMMMIEFNPDFSLK